MEEIRTTLTGAVERAQAAMAIKNAKARMYDAAAATTAAATYLTASQLERFGVSVPAAVADLGDALQFAETLRGEALTPAVEAAARGLSEAVTLRPEEVATDPRPEAAFMTSVVRLRACLKALDAARTAAE